MALVRLTVWSSIEEAESKGHEETIEEYTVDIWLDPAEVWAAETYNNDVILYLRGSWRIPYEEKNSAGDWQSCRVIQLPRISVNAALSKLAMA